ncbi:hypothetical protein ACFGVS_21640 [Mucilaginibacter sp. AW1-7]|uniref:hypothetical protein n=1 Tax=Mucilaginibacter sp. AW1-7 TaxID=3349874 RepID=UPI003F732E85
MKKYTVNEFLDGDEVFHLSNSRLKMIVIGRDETYNEVTCRWVDSSGKSIKETYLAAELAKISDRPSRQVSLSPRRPSNFW